AAGSSVGAPGHGAVGVGVMTGDLVARRQGGRSRHEPTAGAAGRPPPVMTVADEEGLDAGAMVDCAPESVVVLGWRAVQRAGQLEVFERAARQLLQSAVGAPHPVLAGAIGERDLDAEARVQAVPPAVDAYPPPAGRDHADPDPPTDRLACELPAPVHA